MTNISNIELNVSHILHYLVKMSVTVLIMLAGLVLQLFGTDYIGFAYVVDYAVAYAYFLENLINEIVDIAVGNSFKMEISDI